MLENYMNTSESEVVRAGAGADFHQAALSECWPGGPVVSSPADCRDVDRDSWKRTQESLPDLSLTNGIEVIAGHTERNNGSGELRNERDSYLDRLYS